MIRAPGPGCAQRTLTRSIDRGVITRRLRTFRSATTEVGEWKEPRADEIRRIYEATTMVARHRGRDLTPARLDGHQILELLPYYAGHDGEAQVERGVELRQ